MVAAVGTMQGSVMVVDRRMTGDKRMGVGGGAGGAVVQQARVQGGLTWSGQERLALLPTPPSRLGL
eukprot:scaffold186738_cov26-Tisochrysis_lutea.AAC.1